jgi:hypothetical protein
MVSLFLVVALAVIGFLILSALVKLLPEGIQKEIGNFLRDMIKGD